MNSPQANPNLAQLAAAARRLTPLLDDIVFVGGCVTGLLVSDPAAAPVRRTVDVDAIVEVASYAQFARLEERLLELGFRRNEAQLICRWFADDVTLDLMPTNPSILGFTNRWYDAASKNAARLRIQDFEIRIVNGPYFLATKLEAFHGRGKRDYGMSHDLEDIITIIDGRGELVEEISKSRADLRQYLSAEFASLLAESAFWDALPGHLLPDAASQQRISIVLQRIRHIIQR